MPGRVERIELQPGYTISRIIKGGWHLAGGHGTIDAQGAVEDMEAFVRSGITTFDCADIYTGVEELIGQFIKKNKDSFKAGDLQEVQIHTKYVPDYNALATLKKKDTEAIIDRSLKRLGVERLDLVQFAWWDYSIPGYVETAMSLAEMQKKGKIRLLGATNFDGIRLREILNAGVDLVSNQVQYSILDRRPETDQNGLMAENKMSYLCYGVLAGGFLSDRYLHKPRPEHPLENRSLVKYDLIIDEFGGYEQFQEVLMKLRQLADKFNTDIAGIAMSYILQKPYVAGIIVGARNQTHLSKLSNLSEIRLDQENIKNIERLLLRFDGPTGPVYELERDKEGRHGKIMRYNLNEQRT